MIKTFYLFLKSFFFLLELLLVGGDDNVYKFTLAKTLNKESKDFEKINDKMKFSKSNKFILSQILKKKKEEKKISHVLNTLDQLKWRHYIVYITAFSQ